MTHPDTHDPEDEKLLRLARSAAVRAAAGAATGQGAAVRDEIGRTYLAGPVLLENLSLTALQAAVAQAVASGVTRLEAVAVHGAEPAETELALLAELGRPAVLPA